MISHLCALLRDCAATNDDSYPTTLKFITEQMDLCNSEKKIYTPPVLRFAMLVRFHSPAAYNAIRDSEFLVLPGHRTLDQYVVPKRSPGVSESRVKELTTVCSKIEDGKREVGIIFDEMACQAQLSFDASGQLFGYALNGLGTETLAESILCFMVTGLNTKFHQVLSFYPVTNPGKRKEKEKE